MRNLPDSKPPKPKVDRASIKEIMDPMGDYSQNVISKMIDRLFSLQSIRNFLVGFLATYIIANADIHLTLSELRFDVSSTNEFFLIVFLTCFPILAFSWAMIKDRNQKDKSIERKVNTIRAWQNFLSNIQPMIKSMKERTQLSLMILSKEINSEDLRDVIIKTFGVDVKNVVEDMALLREDFEPLRKLADQARQRELKRKIK